MRSRLRDLIDVIQSLRALLMGLVVNASTSADNVQAAGRASLIAMLGVAGPPMTAAAILLMYKVALALFIGLGPIFIICLMFKVTEQMFWSWLKYGLGTSFSMAVLSFMVSIVMELTLKVAVALWASSAISSLLDVQGSRGLTNQAMQQGGIGLLMTTLLISAPPMAAAFFGGTMGNFNPYPTVSGGQQNAGSPGPGGQAARKRLLIRHKRLPHNNHPADSVVTPPATQASPLLLITIPIFPRSPSAGHRLLDRIDHDHESLA